MAASASPSFAPDETFEHRAPGSADSTPGAARYAHGVLQLHQVNAVLLIAANLGAFGWGAYYLRRHRAPHAAYRHVLALAQSLLIAQIALGLLLLSGHHRARDHLHYLYGVLALLAVLAPWLYAPSIPERRLAWFVGATGVASALAVRAYVTAG